jgi:predicted  nucleic acid-binding Zn-ribbon protein
MSTIQNEIQNIKLKNPQNSELLDNVQTENRVLKAKLSDMESQMNSLSTNMASNFDRRSSFQNQREIESIQEIKVMFEDKISQMQKENQEKE